MFDFINLELIIYILPAVIIALTLHEVSHGYAAYLLGDNTAKNMGRLSLNPLKHLDPIGTLALLFLGFGWAKPVPINPRNFKDFRRGIFYTSLAGPLSNLIQAFIGGGILYLLYNNTSLIYLNIGSFSYNFYTLALYYVFINFVLMVFNLIPLPPLDGSKIMYAFLRDETIIKFQNNQRTFQIVLLVLIIFGVIGTVISPIVNNLVNGLMIMFGLPTI